MILNRSAPKTLLIKYADDITASVPVTTGPNLTDSSHYEVENIKRWADKNLMTLNMKTFEMVVKGKTRQTPLFNFKAQGSPFRS